MPATHVGLRNPYPGGLGVVEEGVPADFLLGDGDPIADIGLVAESEQQSWPYYLLSTDPRSEALRCLFCRVTSDAATSVEHVIPQSLGNSQVVLPRGMICDPCNNYIARKIEKPLLAHESFRNLRAWYRIPNKRRRHASLYGVIPGLDIGVNFRIGQCGPELQLERSGDAAAVQAHVQGAGERSLTAILFPREMRPPEREMSRLLAKIALEVFALRLSAVPAELERLIDDPHWDRIRRWVRVGDNADHWPFHMRQVYPEATLMTHPDSGDWVHAGYIIDLLLTRRREHYIVMIFYGYEFALNLGGPSIKGYEEWLEEHPGLSPLIERLGLRLEADADATRLIGQPSLQAGVDFDLAQGVEGMWDD